MNKAGYSPIVIFGSAFLIVFALFVAFVFESTKMMRNFSNLRVTYDGIAAYAKDHGGRLPAMSSPEVLEKSLCPRYVSNKIRLRDTYTYKPYLPNSDLSYKSLASLQKLPCPPVLFTSSTGGGMYANGHMARPDGCR